MNLNFEDFFSLMINGKISFINVSKLFVSIL